MSLSENIILADIGGTFARFAPVLDAYSFGEVRKYRVEDFETAQQALEKFCAEQNLQNKGALRIATAGYEEGGVWKFVNHNKWEMGIKDLNAAGWDVQMVLNDFEAATWSLPALGDDEKKALREGKGASDSLCLLGPGTGLGLGYMHNANTKPFVQKTHGGHIAAAAISEEQALVIQTINRLNRGKKVTVFENLVSGPGLYNLYAACCLMAGKIRRFAEVEQIIEFRDDPEVIQAMRLFHEFLGIFSAGAVVSGNAYGGLYLTGGVLERLAAAGLFDLESFYRFFDLQFVDSVRRDLAATPIFFITIPNPALKGLLVADHV